MKNKYFYGKQYISAKDIHAVTKVLKSENLTNGPEVVKLERNFSKYLSCKYSITCNSGTSAIFLALNAIKLKKGDNVIVPAINFVAAANMCKYLGANVYFADVDSKTFQITPDTINHCIKKNKLKNIKLFFTMYLGGAAFQIKSFETLKKKLNCYFFEDACHALGGVYDDIGINRKIGSSRYSDLSIFSFHPVKTITCGEGGMICTNSKLLSDKIKLLRSHGITSRKNFSYNVVNSGFNFRLSDLNCALLNSQLRSINDFVSKRRSLVKTYYKYLQSVHNKIEIINYKSLHHSAWHLLVLKINFEKIQISKQQFFNQLKKKKIILQLHYIPTYKFYNFNKQRINLKNSEYYHRHCFSLPLFYSLKIKDIQYICKHIKKIIS